MSEGQDHAPLPPSDAARWVICTASVPLQARYPDLDDNDQAKKEGDAAHWIAASSLHTRTMPSKLYAPGFATPNGIIVDDEMLEGADLYVTDVLETLPDVSPIVESKVFMGRVHEENYGTPDAYKSKLLNGAGVLAVWDFKFGHGFIDAFENWQLIDYALGVLEGLEREGADLNRIEMVLTVVQPRNYSSIGPIRRWTISASDLRKYEHTLSLAAAEALGPNPRAVVGPQCDHCNGRFGCATLHAAADRAADLAGTAVPLELPPDAVGIELRMLQRAAAILDARMTGLEAMGLQMLKAGQRVPFFQTEQTTGKENWKGTPEEIFAIGDAMGVNLRRAAPITPNQAIKAGMLPDLVKSYVFRPPGALKLKPVDDTKARKVFSR